jgi:hypothetical protein
MATLTELETTWSLDDMDRAIDYLRATDFIESKMMEIPKCK